MVLKTYADEKHLDVTKAVNLLPALPTPTPMLASAGSTEVPNPVVQIVVPTSGERGALEGSAGHRSPSGEKSARAKKTKNSRDSVKTERAGEGTRTLGIQLGKQRARSFKSSK